MVGSVTSLTRSGLRDWLVQRISAVILALYSLFLTSYLIGYSPLQYQDWHALFANGYMRVFSFLALVSLVYHTWIGMWTIFTDYIKCACARLTLQVLVVMTLLGYMVWGIDIVWGI